jgi:hypothetical protein
MGSTTTGAVTAFGALGVFAILTGAGAVTAVTGVVEAVETGAGEAEVFVVFAIVICLYPL